MKRFLSAVLLLSASSFAQAYTVYDLSTPLDFPAFAENENILTWGENNRLGDAAAISYSFAGAGYSCNDASCFSLNDFMPAGYQGVITSAFDAWASVSDLSFNQLDDQSGDIVFGGEWMDGVSGQLGDALVRINYASNGVETTSSIFGARVHFDRNEPWSLDNSETPLFSIALHEIGHALGLRHSEDSSAIMFPQYIGINALQADDIAGIQYLYGASSVSPIPEPSTYLMFLLGLAMIAGIGRKVVSRS